MVDWEQRPAWVAVFDILGFKALIREADKDFPRSLLTSRLSDLVASLESNLDDAAHFEYLVFSDTFVLLARDLEIQRYPWFLRVCKNLIEKSITVELPLRGAISAGSIFVSRTPQMLLGSAFLEAHEYCEAQDWIGLLMTPSATRLVRSHGLEPLRHDFVADELPLRTRVEATDVLAYRFQNGSANFASPLVPHLSQMRHFAPEPAKEKYGRTISFIERHYFYIGRGDA